jgi:hypothetical protein
MGMRFEAHIGPNIGNRQNQWLHLYFTHAITHSDKILNAPIAFVRYLSTKRSKFDRQTPCRIYSRELRTRKDLQGTSQRSITTSQVTDHITCVVLQP